MYKPSPLAYPPIVAGMASRHPLTRPMGPYMTPSAVYAPQYIPFHHPMGYAAAEMESEPGDQSPAGFFDMAGKSSLMLLSGAAFGGVAAILSYFVAGTGLDLVSPKSTRGPMLAKTLDLVETGVVVVPFAVGIGMGTYAAYVNYLEYRASKA